MGKRGSRTWHRNEHSWRKWPKCWVSPCSAAHAPARSSRASRQPRAPQKGEQLSELLQTTATWTALFGANVCYNHLHFSHSGEVSLGPGCAEEGDKLLPVLHMHLPGVMQAAPVALWGWSAVGCESPAHCYPSISRLMLKWFVFFAWQIKKETFSDHELSVHEGGTASAVTPFSEADSTNFKLKNK